MAWSRLKNSDIPTQYAVGVVLLSLLLLIQTSFEFSGDVDNMADQRKGVFLIKRLDSSDQPL